jgi:hypothetical protein
MFVISYLLSFEIRRRANDAGGFQKASRRKTRPCGSAQKHEAQQEETRSRRQRQEGQAALSYIAKIAIKKVVSGTLVPFFKGVVLFFSCTDKSQSGRGSRSGRIS